MKVNGTEKLLKKKIPAINGNINLNKGRCDSLYSINQYKNRRNKYKTVWLKLERSSYLPFFNCCCCFIISCIFSWKADFLGGFFLFSSICKRIFISSTINF
ncbi:MAG: hypothetical protein JWN78_52 [Bacteroidota bacterium]|nr:hypothetical protein [Bacteroidota bacterium]